MFRCTRINKYIFFLERRGKKTIEEEEKERGKERRNNGNEMERHKRKQEMYTIQNMDTLKLSFYFFEEKKTIWP